MSASMRGKSPNRRSASIDLNLHKHDLCRVRDGVASWPRCPRTAALTTAGRDRAGYAGPAPKEQPPRKLSGKRTGRSATLWKEAGATIARLTEGVTASALPWGNAGCGKSLRSSDRGGADGRLVRFRARTPCRVSNGRSPRCREPPRDATRPAPSRARRADGAVCRLFHAGPIPDRHPRRAQAGARAGGALRRLPHGPGLPGRARPCHHGARRSRR